jgi:ATP-dependent Clp protease ATP-binding subunit ClpC
VFERFTDRARRVLVLAQEEACLLDHNFIGTEHILLGLIREGEGIAAKALEALGISLTPVREKVEEMVGPAGSATTGSPPFTPRAKSVLELSLREALQFDHKYIGTEHMLLGLVRQGEGVAVQVLVTLGVDLSRVRLQVIQLLSGYQSPGEARARAEVFGPRCPACGGFLEGQVAYRVLTVEPVDRSLEVGPLSVAFVYCRHCGTTIAHTPTGGDGALWGWSSVEGSGPLAGGKDQDSPSG